MVIEFLASLLLQPYRRLLCIPNWTTVGSAMTYRGQNCHVHQTRGFDIYFAFGSMFASERSFVLIISSGDDGSESLPCRWA